MRQGERVKAVGIDIGSTTTKVVLAEITADGVTEIAVQVGQTPTTAPELLGLAARLCREAVEGRGSEVAAVGIASMAETGVPVDADGEPLTELLRWDASLGADEAARMTADAPEIFAATGVRLAAKTPLATWAWLRRERPAAWSRMACWLGAADLLAHAMTGEAVTDHTLAGRTGGYRLPAPARSLPTAFDAELLALVGLVPDRLPGVAAPDGVPPGTAPRLASAMGLGRGVPVVVAGHDHQVAAWAAGVREPGDVADSLGTAEAVLTVLPQRPEPEAVRRQGMSLVRSVGGAHDALVAGSSSAGGTLAHWLDGVVPDRREALLTDAAEDRDQDSAPTGAAVPPYLRGRQTPAPDAAARPGTPPPSWPPARRLRAVVEGISYQSRWMIETQAALGRPPQRVAVIAGSRLPRVWTDTLGDVLPWPVAPSSAAEPVATGAALLAAVRAGLLGPVAEQLLHAPSLVGPVRPPAAGDRHRAAFSRFVDAVGG